jgi:hypothetical protein
MRRAILAASLIVPGLIVGLLAQQITLPPVQTPNKTANDLMTLGWLDETTAGADAEAVDLACDAYCEFWGLEPGEMAQHIAGRGCMVPDMLIEEANWPQSCRHDLGMFIDWQGFRESAIGMSRAEAEDLFDQALMEWNNSIGVNLHITTDLAAAKCYVSWQGLGGSTLAWSHLADNSCSDDKKQRYDIRRWSKHQFYQTVIHECGHLIGLPHRRGNYVMNPIIITSLDGLTDTDIRDARRLGYGEPTDPPKPHPPAPNGITGTITLKDGLVVPASKIKTINLTFGVGKRGGVIVLPPITAQ